MRKTRFDVTTTKVGKLELETQYNDKRVFYMGRSKAERRKMLKDFIYLRLHERWMTIQETIAAFERHFVNEIIDSL